MRASAIVMGVLLLTACRGEIGPWSTPRLDGVCGPGVVPTTVVVVDRQTRDHVADAVVDWGDLLWLDPDRDGRDCDDSWLVCHHTILVTHEPLEPGVLGVADLATSGGRPLACVARISSDWPLDVAVIQHELGHCLGLDHSFDPVSIMHDPIEYGAGVTVADLDAAWSDTCEP